MFESKQISYLLSLRNCRGSGSCAPFLSYGYTSCNLPAHCHGKDEFSDEDSEEDSDEDLDEAAALMAMRLEEEEDEDDTGFAREDGNVKGKGKKSQTALTKNGRAIRSAVRPCRVRWTRTYVLKTYMREEVRDRYKDICIYAEYRP